MWVKKSGKEIDKIKEEKEVRKKSLKRPMIVGIIVSVTVTLLWSIGYRGGLSQGIILISRKTSSIEDLLRFIPITMIIFVITVTVTYRNQQKYEKLFKGKEILLCDKCFTPQNETVSNRCSCGGCLEPFDYFDDVIDKS